MGSTRCRLRGAAHTEACKAGLAALMLVASMAAASAQSASNPQPVPQALGRGAEKPTSPQDIVDKFDQLVMEHRSREAIDRFISPGFVEHDPAVKGGGKSGLYEYMMDEGWDAKQPNPNLKDIVDREMAAGNFVIVHHHIFHEPGDRGIVFVDIFRLEDGWIVEHWDVMQHVPEKSNDNKNTMW